ncbi:MAG: VOC family protein [Pseudomonadota bacterium]
MIQSFDHCTIAVRDLDAARSFFSLLGFEEEKQKTTVIKGEVFAGYMGVENLEADHVTLIVPGLSPRFEIQLLHYRNPEVVVDPLCARLDKTGYNHICFKVNDAEAMVEKLKSNGVEVRSELKGFHERLLYFITGPEGITIELAQWGVEG